MNGSRSDRRLKEPKGLPSDDHGGNAANHVEHGQGEKYGQHRLHEGIAEPAERKDRSEEPHHRQPSLGQRRKQETEDQVSDKQRADGDDAGQDASLHTANGPCEN